MNEASYSKADQSQELNEINDKMRSETKRQKRNFRELNILLMRSIAKLKKIKITKLFH